MKKPGSLAGAGLLRVAGGDGCDQCFEAAAAP